MNSRHRNCVAVALSAGVAVFLASTAAGGESAAQANTQWFQQNWQTAVPQSYVSGAPYAVATPYGPLPWWGPDLSQMGRHWGGGMAGTSSNLQDLGGYYRFVLSLPGVNPNDLTMRVDGRVMSIAVQSQGVQGRQEGGQWQTFYNNFQQVFTLPEAVDSSRMQSHFENGVLTVNLPKLPRTTW